MSDKGFVTVVCEVALSNMFGYSTDLRRSTQVCSPPPTLSASSAVAPSGWPSSPDNESPVGAQHSLDSHHSRLALFHS